MSESKPGMEYPEGKTSPIVLRDWHWVRECADLGD